MRICICAKIELSTFLGDKYKEFIFKIRCAFTSHRLLFTCKVRNSGCCIVPEKLHFMKKSNFSHFLEKYRKLRIKSISHHMLFARRKIALAKVTQPRNQFAQFDVSSLSFARCGKSANCSVLSKYCTQINTNSCHQYHINDNNY